MKNIEASSEMELRTPTTAEFLEIAKFSFDNFVNETAISTGDSVEVLKEKLGGPPLEIGEQSLWYTVNYLNERVGFIWIELDKPNKTAFGYDIYLEPMYRSRGIGRRVMELCGLELKNHCIRSVKICVYHHNQIARSLYSSLGFIIEKYDEERKQYTLKLDLDVLGKREPAHDDPENKLSCPNPNG